MKRFTVILATLAIMMMAVSANAGLLTDPDTGKDVTSWSFLGYSQHVNGTSHAAAGHTHLFGNDTIAIEGVYNFATRGTDSFNMTTTATLKFGNTTGGVSPSNFNYVLNSSVGCNMTSMDVRVAGNGTGNPTAYGFLKKLPDGKSMVLAASGSVNKTNNVAAGNAVTNGTVMNVIVSPQNSFTTNTLVGNWKLFGFFTHNMSVRGAGTPSVNKSAYDVVIADVVFNGSAGQMTKNTINSTIYYKRSTGSGFGAATRDIATASISNGFISLSADYVYFDRARLDATSNMIVSAGNTTGSLYSVTSHGNTTSFVVAIRVDDSSKGKFSSFKDKAYSWFGMGGYGMKYGTGVNNFTSCGSVGSFSLASNKWKGNGANFTAWNTTNYMTPATGHIGNGTFIFGSYGMTNGPLAAFKMVDSGNSALSNSNFTGAMRVDGNLYVGITRATGVEQLVLIVPSSSDAFISQSSLSSNFITDTQLLAAAGVDGSGAKKNATISDTQTALELSHISYPTSGVNARPIPGITVSTYEASVISAADNASVMNSKLLNVTAKADSADYTGNFTSETWGGAPDSLKSMYAFNATSFLLRNKTGGVSLIAKWVFVANGTAGIGNVAGLKVSDLYVVKYMKKYQKANNATTWTIAYGDNKTQKWSGMVDKDGNALKLNDGTAFFTRYGTTAGTAGTILPANYTFTAGQRYVLWALLQNNNATQTTGLYDTDNSTDFVFDPPRIVVDVVTPISSSSSSGCVFNPVAGFGLEWLLLLLAPAVGIIRNRFRK